MTTVWIVLGVAALASGLLVLAGVLPSLPSRSQALPSLRRSTTQAPDGHVAGRAPRRRILFPFVASALSVSALEAALRLARAEDATLVAVYLLRVPMRLPLNAPLPKQAETALTLHETIEQRAAAYHVPIDARIERGRDSRHALRQAIESCSYDRIVMAAAVHGRPGFDGADVAWLLEHAPGEIVVLRAADTNVAKATPSADTASVASAREVLDDRQQRGVIKVPVAPRL